jgi:hypothetical protein
MAQFKHDWPKLDPKIDALKQNGLDASAIARELNIPRKTLTDHRPDLRKSAGTPQLPAKVTHQVPKSYPRGTQPALTAASPNLDTLAVALMPRLLDSMRPAFDAFDAWLAQQVPSQVPIQVPQQVLEEVPGPTAVEYLPGTSGDPLDPEHKAQFPWHVPKGELWELRTVAQGLQLDMSLLLRKLWRAFMRTPEVQAGLQQYLTEVGTHPNTQAGTHSPE